MAILKIMDKAYADNEAEKTVYNYIMCSNKTNGLTSGYNVYKEYYLNIAETVHSLFSNNESHRFIHFIISYENDHDIRTIYSDAMHTAMFFRDNQVIFGIHLNTDNQHIHFMVNNVRFTDGYAIKDYRKLHNELTAYCNMNISEEIRYKHI